MDIDWNDDTSITNGIQLMMPFFANSMRQLQIVKDMEGFELMETIPDRNRRSSLVLHIQVSAYYDSIQCRINLDIIQFGT